MPVTPLQVEAFINSSDGVDEMISFIDGQLGCTREKRYRHGDYDDYYYVIDCYGALNKHQREELRAVYQDAGWPVVQVFECDRDPGKTTVRLFRNHNSRHL